MDFRIISIGALSQHELWTESVGPQTAHATTTLVRSKDKVVIIDPALPPQVIAARLAERVGIGPDAVTDVFLTNFRPAHRMGLAAFQDINWYISGMERETIGQRLIEQFKQTDDAALQKTLENEIAMLKRCSVAPDRIADQVDIFPLPGFTPGTCGLLLNHINSTTLIAGDAVATAEHLEQGRVLRGCFDNSQARESLAESIEIADVIIPGHDNLLLNPTRRPM